MGVAKQIVGESVVLYAEGDLTTGGSGATFEQQIQNAFQDGDRHVIVELSRARMVDSSGIRALVRGYTTAQRLGGSFTLLNPNDRLLRLLRMTHLDSVIPIIDSLDAIQDSRRSK
jgi:anti-sigma B factor antagonist